MGGEAWIDLPVISDALRPQAGVFTVYKKEGAFAGPHRVHDSVNSFQSETDRSPSNPLADRHSGRDLRAANWRSTFGRAFIQ